MHDPPPPYTSTDPSAIILPTIQRPINTSNLRIAQDALVQNSPSLIIGLATQESIPAAVSLPGAPLPPSATISLVPGPPLPGQGI